MATIKFTTNLPLSSDPNCPKPWLFDPKYFDSIPDEAGVYIVGVKILVSDPPQEFDANGNPIQNCKPIEKFCPLIVGEGNLKTRIQDHYFGTNTSLNSNEELFETSANAQSLYDSIEIFEKYYASVRRMHKNKNRQLAEAKIFTMLKGKSLIWFPNPDFFDIYLGHMSSSYPRNNNVGHNFSIYKDLNKSLSALLRDRITKSKENIYNSYFYTYFVCNSNQTKTIEFNTKEKLKKIQIYTHADAKGIIDNDLCIDLTDIKDDLVNMTPTAFPNPLIV